MGHASVAPIMVVMGDFIGAGGAMAPIDPHLPREQIDKAVSGLIVRHSIGYVVGFFHAIMDTSDGRNTSLMSVCILNRFYFLSCYTCLILRISNGFRQRASPKILEGS